MGKQSPISIAQMQRPAMIRISSAAIMLGISRSTLYRRASDGQFNIIKRGSMSYVPMKDIDAWLDPSEENMVG